LPPITPNLDDRDLWLRALESARTTATVSYDWDAAAREISQGTLSETTRVVLAPYYQQITSFDRSTALGSSARLWSTPPRRQFLQMKSTQQLLVMHLVGVKPRLAIWQNTKVF